jgi:hypothetical protein
METPQEYFEILRQQGWTEDITIQENPDYTLPFYQTIFRLMKGYSKLSKLFSSSKEKELLYKYSMWLTKHGYMDTDWKDEKPFAIDEYLKTNKK